MARKSRWFSCTLLALSLISPCCIAETEPSTREIDLQDILNKRLLETSISQRLFSMYASQAVEASSKKIDEEELVKKLRERLQTPSARSTLYAGYKEFSDKEIHELRAIFNTQVYQKYSELSFPIVKAEHEFIRQQFALLASEYPEDRSTGEKKPTKEPFEVTSENLQELLKNTKPIVIDVYAPWCAPCRRMAPTFKKVSEKYDSIIFAKMNSDEQKKIAEQYDVKSLPTLLFVKKGQVVMRSVGFLNQEELEKKLQEFINV